MVKKLKVEVVTKRKQMKLKKSSAHLHQQSHSIEKQNANTENSSSCVCKIKDMKCHYDRLKLLEKDMVIPLWPYEDIDFVSTQGRQIYMCEHEKPTMLHLVQSLAYHTRMMSVKSTQRHAST